MHAVHMLDLSIFWPEVREFIARIETAPVDSIAGDLSIKPLVKCLVDRESPPIVVSEEPADRHALHTVAKGVGGALAALLRELADHIVYGTSRWPSR